MGRPCQSAGLVDPLKQRVGVIPVDVIPGNIRGYVLAEQMPVVGRELVAVDVLEPVLQAAGRSGKPETVLWSVRENQGIPWASINAASSFTVMEPSDSMV